MNLSRPRFVPLTVKVNLLVLATLMAGIGVSTLVLAGRLFQTIDQYSERSQATEARIVYSAIETLMLPGQAELAQGYFRLMRQVDTGFRPAIYRVDGTEAFIDNATILKVDAFQKGILFPPRANPGKPPRIAVEGAFSAAINGPDREIRFETALDGRTISQVYKPILNLPKCTGCHGADQTFRGVLSLSADISQRQADQRFAIGAACLLFLFSVSLATVLLTRFLGRAVLGPVRQIGEVCRLVAAGDFGHRVELARHDELASLGTTVNRMIDGLVERFKLSRFVSGSTLQSLGAAEGSRKVHKVVFFSDIRGFTAFTDVQDPARVVQTLNRILRGQTGLIQAAGGDIDKYVGDEIFAIFDGPDAARRACEAALAIQRRFPAGDTDAAGLRLGIGIHEGEVIEGVVGSETRADYTLIGDPVNLGARLCAAAGPGEILVSEAVIASLRALRKAGGPGGRLDAFRLRGPSRLRLKGKQAEVTVFRLTEAGDPSAAGPAPGEAPPGDGQGREKP